MNNLSDVHVQISLSTHDFIQVPLIDQNFGMQEPVNSKPEYRTKKKQQTVINKIVLSIKNK